MTIEQALKQGITKLTHPTWSRGYIGIVPTEDGFYLYGYDLKEKKRFNVSTSEYSGYSDYVEYVGWVTS